MNDDPLMSIDWSVGERVARLSQNALKDAGLLGHPREHDITMFIVDMLRPEQANIDIGSVMAAFTGKDWEEFERIANRLGYLIFGRDMAGVKDTPVNYSGEEGKKRLIKQIRKGLSGADFGTLDAIAQMLETAGKE